MFTKTVPENTLWVEASSRVRESIVLTLLGGVMTGLSLLIMDSATAEQTPKKAGKV